MLRLTPSKRAELSGAVRLSCSACLTAVLYVDAGG